jgi:hypothetical protein
LSFVVGEVVGGSDLHAAGAELTIHEIIGNDRDQAIGQWQPHALANQPTVAVILGVHGHGAVAEQGFWPCGGNHQMTAAVFQRIAQMPQVSILFCR